MTTNMDRIILSLKPEQRKWLKEESIRTKRAVSWLIRDAIKQYMNQKDSDRQQEDKQNSQP